MAIRYLSGINVDSNTLFVDDANNRVGIGTGSPGYLLDVAGTSRSTTFLSTNATGSTGLQITSATTSGGGAVIRLTKDAADRQVYQTFESDTLYIGVAANQTTVADIGTKAGVSLDLKTAYSTRIRITDGGNVGIGTTAPSSILHVDGIDPYVRINNVGSANTQGIKISYNYSDTHGFHLLYNGNNAASYVDNTYPITSGQPWGDIYFRQNSAGTMVTRMTIKADGGNVGIGTTSPDTPLVVQGGAGGTGGWNRTATLSATYPGLIFNSNGTKWGGMAYDYSAAMRFWVNATNNDIFAGTLAMSILNNGSIGIGTASPSYKLEVNGSFGTVTSGIYLEYNSGILYHSGGSGNYYQYISGANYLLSNRTATGALVFSTVDTERMRITAAGNVGIGTSSPVVKLQVDGTITSTGVLTAYTSVPSINIGHNGDSAFIAATSGSGANTPISFSVGNNNEKMRITADGNVGIGTTSPSHKFVVSNGSAEVFQVYNSGEIVAVTNYIYAAYNGGTSFYSQGPASFRNGIYSDTAAYLTINGGTSNNTYFSGNVGIGTTSPTTALDVNGTISVGGSPIASFSGNYNRILRPNGTVGIYLGNATDAGNYYDNTTHYFRSSGGGTTYAVINYLGNVGIGTTSPSDKLTVSVGNVEGIRVQSSNSGFVEIGKTNGARWRWTNEYNTANIFELLVNDLNGGTPGQNVFTANGVNGNVGIGTTSPSYKLDVNGATQIQNELILSTNDAAFRLYRTTGINYFDWSSGQDLRFSTVTTIGGAGRSTAVTFLSNGNVGIGTTSPSQKLTVSGSTGDILGITNGTTTGYGYVDNNGFGLFTSSGAGGTGIYYRTANIIDHYVNGSIAMRLNSTGNVGIGTTSPTSIGTGITSLDIQGSNAGGIAFGPSGTKNYIYGASTMYVEAHTTAVFSTSGTEKMRLTTGGQLIVGGTTVGYAGTKLQVGNTSDSQNGLNILTSTTGYGYILFGDGAGADTYVGQIWYYHGDNYMGFQTNGSEKLRITSAGNVGIGTTSPSTKLDVIGVGAFGTMTSSRGLYSNGLSIQNNTGEATSLFIWQSGVASAHIGSPANSTSLHIVNSYNTGLITDPNSIVLTNTGNVGIGTTAPGAKLEIAQNTDNTDGPTLRIANNANTLSNGQLIGAIDFYNGDDSGTGNAVGAFIRSFTADAVLPVSSQYLSFAAGGTTERMRIASTGATRLNAYGSGSFTGTVAYNLAVDSSGNIIETAGGVVDGSGTANYVSKWSDANTLTDSIIYDNGTSVGIGTTTPNPFSWATKTITVVSSASNSYAALEAYGNGTGAGALLLGNTSILRASIVAEDGSNLLFATNAGNTGSSQSERMRITAAGRVGIATTDTNLARLRVIGEGGVGNAAIMSDYGNASVLGEVSTIAYRGGAWHTLYVSESGSSATNAVYVTGTKPVILNAGNVGIGTTSPTNTLDVLGSATIRNSSGGGALNIGTNSGRTEYQYITLGGGTGGTDYGWQVGRSPQTGGVINDGFYIYDIKTNNAPFTIALGGNVGIGTTSPSSALDVSLSSGGTSGIRFKGWSDASTPYLLSLGTQTYPDQFQIKSVNGLVTMGIVGATGAAPDLAFQTNTTERMRITSAGNVGIGTTSPVEKLDVRGGAYINGGTNDNAYDATLYVTANSSNDWGIFVSKPSHDYGIISQVANGSDFGFSVYDGTTHNFRVKGNGTTLIQGNVGIGTTSPAKILTIAASSQTWAGAPQVAFYDTVSGQVDARNWTVGAISTNYGNFTIASSTAAGGDPTTPRLTINKDGNVGIGNTAPTQALHVTGSARVTGAYYDSNNSAGSSGQVLSSTGSGTDWVSLSEITGVDGTGTANYIAKWSDTDTITNSQVFDNGTNVGINNASPKTKLDVNGAIGFGSKTLNISDTFVTVLTVNMSNHTGCYVKITAFGDWNGHSAVAYLGEFFLQNGASAYNEPGVIIRQVDNTNTDDVVAQIVDPAGTGTRDFEIQLKTTSASGVPFSAAIQYEVRGQYNSVS